MKKQSLKNCSILFTLFLLYLCQDSLAFPREQIMQALKGPWELCVKISVQESDIVFPIEVENENEPQKLNQSLPVIGTPIQIKLLQYCPDLQWRNKVVESPEGGPVARLTVSGKNLQQEVLLLVDVPEKHSVTSGIGGLALCGIRSDSDPEAVLKEMISQKAIGLLTFWNDPTRPQEFVVGKKGTFKIPGTSFTVEILEYVPHYSIDRETKKVTNYSENPVNPALKIRLSDGKETYEQWLWSNFSSSPHTQLKLPMKATFSDFDLGPSGNRFILVSGKNSNEVMLYYLKDDKIRYEPMQINKAYAFRGQEDYTFTLESMLPRGVIDRTWANDTEKLEHPALVLSLETGRDRQETVVELNKPSHVKTEYGTVVLLYRQQTQNKQHGDK